MKKIALGKGLDALIGEARTGIGDEEATVKMILTENVVENEYQPRRSFNKAAFEDLKSSVKKRGIIQPILVSKFGEKFRLIAGERRLRVAKDLKIQKAINIKYLRIFLKFLDQE